MTTEEMLTTEDAVFRTLMFRGASLMEALTIVSGVYLILLLEAQKQMEPEAFKVMLDSALTTIGGHLGI